MEIKCISSENIGSIHNYIFSFFVNRKLFLLYKKNCNLYIFSIINNFLCVTELCPCMIFLKLYCN